MIIFVDLFIPNTQLRILQVVEHAENIAHKYNM